MAATDVEQLVLQMSADMTRLNRNVVTGQRAFDRQLLAMERRAQAADRNLSRAMGRAGQNMTNALKGSLMAIAPTLAAAFSTQQVIQYADAYTGLQNRLKAAGLEGQNLKRVEDALFTAANKNGVAVGATAELYQRAAMASENLGFSQTQILQVVSGTTAALKLQGTSTTEASGALLQLGQLLGGHMVQSQEYNSLVDGLPVILEAVAKGSERWGGSVVKLTRDVKASKVTAQEFAEAMLKGFGDIETRAGSATTTVAQSLEVLNNELGRFIGQTDSGVSATERMAQGIIALAGNLDLVVQVVGVVAAIMGTRFVLAMTAGSGAMIANSIAAARLTGFQVAMTASMTGTSAATVVATGAMARFNAMLAANPVGAVIVAVAALTAGVLYLVHAQSDATIAAKAQAKAHADAQVATTALDKYIRQLVTANEAETASIREKITALLDEQRVKAQIARNTYLDAKEKERRQNVVRDEIQANPVFGMGGIPAGGLRFEGGSRQGGIGPNGNPIDTVKDTTELRRLRAEAEAAEESFGRLKDTAEDALRPARVAPTAPPAAKPKKSGGPSAEDLAATREMLRLQGELDILQARGRDDEARAIQRQIDLINLTKRYEDAKVPNAQAAAKAQIDALSAAEDTEREIDKILEARLRQIDREDRGKQALEEQAQRQNDLLLDRLNYEAELARLAGDPVRIEAAERELFITERVNELLRLRNGLITEAEARTQATSEYGALRSADREGKTREEFRRAFKDGIRAALDGDMGGLLESLADRFTDRMLDNLADNLFDLVSQAAKGFGSGGGGGGWMSALSSVFGMRASGGSVTAGSPYIVGERRPEVFVPHTNGTVIPSVNAAMGRMDQVGAGRGQQSVAVRIDVNDDRFNAYVDGRAAPLAVQSTAAGVAYSQDQARSAGRRRRLSLI